MGRRKKMKGVTKAEISAVMSAMRALRSSESCAQAGEKGGAARMAKMDPAARSELGKAASVARWGEGYVGKRRARRLAREAEAARKAAEEAK